MSKQPGKLRAWLQGVFGNGGTAAQDRQATAKAQDTPAADPAPVAAENHPGELFVRLLLELPAQRRLLVACWRNGDLERLQDCVHRLLGATVYCEAPELESALRELHRALQSRDRNRIARCQASALAMIDSTLQHCGCGSRQP